MFVRLLKEVVIHISVLWLFNVQDMNVEKFCKGLRERALSSTTKDVQNYGRVGDEMCIQSEGLKARDYL